MSKFAPVKDQYIDPQFFSDAPVQVPIRVGFGEGLLALGETHADVVALCADLTDSTKMGDFARAYPNRYVQIGVAEQNLAACASGMAAMGKLPFVSSYAMFSPGRNWEQIRTTICYNNQPVVIVGSHAGVSVGPDGGTHQAVEDIAITRVLPRMCVVVPADSIEAKKATSALADRRTPAYIRLAREKTPVVTTEESPFVIGKANIIFSPSKPQASLIACGPMVAQALLAAQALFEEGIMVSVVNNHTVKPLDGDTILKVAKEAGRVVTIEEHQRAGGMGSAIAEFLVTHHPVPMTLLGVDDVFGQSGTPEELVEHYGLGVSHIIDAVKQLIQRA